MNLKLIKAELLNKRNVILYGRDEEGQKKAFINKTFRPYFYVPVKEDIEDQEIISYEDGFKSIYDDELTKVVVSAPYEVKRLRDKFSQHFEADIPYPRRFLIDKKIYSGFNEKFEPVEPPVIKPKVCYLDIEVFSSYGTMPDPNKDMVITIGISDGNEFLTMLLDFSVYGVTKEEIGPNHTLFKFSSESELLHYYIDFMKSNQFDIITGWNIDFDMDYLKKRVERFNIWYRYPGTCIFDLLTGYKKLFRRRSYRLADIAFDEGLTADREGKVDYGKLWNNDKVGLVARNTNHVTWCSKIDSNPTDEKHGNKHVLDYFWNMKEMAGLEDIKETLYNSILLDTLILRKTQWVLPSRKYDIEPEEYEGAFVLQPKGGIYKNVAVFDLSRFYPNIILQEHLDPRILYEYKQYYNVQKVESWDHYKKYASTKTESLILSIVKELIEERTRLEKAGHKDKVATIKTVLNSTYGVIAFPKFRVHNMEIPARVTEVARTVITGLANAVGEELGYNVLYMDTDSIFVEGVEKDKYKEVENSLNEMLKRWGDYSIKMDKYFVSCLMLDLKKRYAGLEENGKLSVTGFERVRTDSSAYTKLIQEDILRMLLEGKTKDDVINYLDIKIKGIYSVPIGDIAVYKTLRRDLSGYQKQQQYYIKATKKLQETEGIQFKEGDAVGIIPEKNAEFGAVVFKDIAELEGQKLDVNYEEVIEKQIIRKVEDLVKLVGVDARELFLPPKPKKTRKKKGIGE